MTTREELLIDGLYPQDYLHGMAYGNILPTQEHMAAACKWALEEIARLSQPREAAQPFTSDQIKHMVNRFLGWKLPERFNPDAGISFKATFNEHTAHPSKHEPSGTNLFDATQADEMVRYMLEGLLATPSPQLCRLPCGECHLQPGEVCDICGKPAAPSLNQEGREHPKFDNPRDQFASTDRLPPSGLEAIARRIDPASPPTSNDDLLLTIHALVECHGRKYPDRYVRVFDRNIVLGFVAAALRGELLSNPPPPELPRPADGEREVIGRAIFGYGWKCCANLGPYVQSTVNELTEARKLIEIFERTNPDLVEKFRDLIEQGKPDYGNHPATQPRSADPVAWIVLSEETGNTRIWWRDKARADLWCKQHLATPIPLYAEPPLATKPPAQDDLCSDCPPVGYETDKTRCTPCPRRMPAQDDEITALKHDIERHLAIIAKYEAQDDGMRRAIIEECAKVADPWPGFNVGQKITEPDISVIEARTKIAAAIRALASEPGVR